jgi:hypothetical protein
LHQLCAGVGAKAARQLAKFGRELLVEQRAQRAVPVSTRRKAARAQLSALRRSAWKIRSPTNSPCSSRSLMLAEAVAGVALANARLLIKVRTSASTRPATWATSV